MIVGRSVHRLSTAWTHSTALPLSDRRTGLACGIRTGRGDFCVCVAAWLLAVCALRARAGGAEARARISARCCPFHSVDETALRCALGRWRRRTAPAIRRLRICQSTPCTLRVRAPVPCCETAEVELMAAASEAEAVDQVAVARHTAAIGLSLGSGPSL
eukprot:6196756-Pleurochrysis_carterae.AAC.1